MPSIAQLKATSTYLDGLTSVHSGNDTEEGLWSKIADALEAGAGVSNARNATLAGYMERAALAAEAAWGGSGAEENATEPGLLKRLVDAMELNAGAGTGDLANRLATRSALTSFAGAFSPTLKNADIDLTNSNRTASLASGLVGGYRTVLGTKALSGKKAFEVTVNAAGDPSNIAIGIGTAATALDNYISLAGGASAGYWGGGAGAYYDDTLQPDAGPANYGVGGVVMILVDTAIGKWWMRLTNTNYGGDPVAGTGGFPLPAGTNFPAVTLIAASDSMTINQGSGVFSSSLPTGFSA